MSETMVGRALGWWIPHPGNLLTAPKSASTLLGGVGLLIGLPIAMHGAAAVFGAMRAPDLPTVAWQLGVGAFCVAIGAALLVPGERNVVLAAPVGDRPRAALAVRASLLVAGLAGFAVMATRLVLDRGDVFRAVGASLYAPGAMALSPALDAMSWSETSHHGAVAGPASVAAVLVCAASLLVFHLASRPMMALGTVRPRRLVLGWAGVTAALSLLALAATGASALDVAVREGASAWRGAAWAAVLAGVAAAMALAAQRRLAIWDHPAAWRDAAVTPDLRIVFADGSGSRPASEYFRGYVGPVVVMPTAESTATVFRGDGAPNDGWLVPGTRAALEEAALGARAVTRMSVAAVGVTAVVPLVAWLASMV